MIYADKQIRNMIQKGIIKNVTEEQVNPASLNIRLGYSFLRPKKPQNVVLGKEVEYDYEHLVGWQTTTIMPGEFLLATTIEEFYIPNGIAAFVQGRSSIGRIGLMVQNAGFVDPGFWGHITLELKNDTQNPIRLVPTYPVAQMVFFTAQASERAYNGKYNGQIEATGSRMEQDDFWRMRESDSQ